LLLPGAVTAACIAGHRSWGALARMEAESLAVKDFVPVSRMASGDVVPTIGPLVPAKDLAGFQALLRTAVDLAAVEFRR
jgi:hypothetical protein